MGAEKQFYCDSLFCFRVPSAGMWGGVGFGVFCYLTDWKVIMDKVPFYNGKFTEIPTEEEE